MKTIKGFSKLSKEAKIEWIACQFLNQDEKYIELLKSYWNKDEKVQKLHDEFIENTVSNFYLPLGVAPNFLIDGKHYCIPMAIEESSVVAAAAKSANFWLDKGGFKTTVISTIKVGHVHFIYKGKSNENLEQFFNTIQNKLIENSSDITKNMVMRGGGILSVNLINKTAELEDYFQLEVKFNTCDSMGANFINSILESFSKTMLAEAQHSELVINDDFEIVMCILSNYTPECIVRAEVTADLKSLNVDENMSGEYFAEKFLRAVKIAEIEPYRAATHNKGIMNGIDSVVIATGNDFRAVEACAHSYAAKTGKYTSLTHAEINNGNFKFWIEVPLSIGTVGGLTNLHPLVKLSLKMLGNPNAEELMRIIAVVGLAQNFSALRSLVTSGIQKGHMKMHLLNILNQLEATEDEKKQIVEHFKYNTVSHHAAVDIFCKIRGIETPQQVKSN